MASSNTSQRDPASAFARRMATSASFKMSSGRVCASVLRAMPTLTEARTSRESIENGAATAACSLRATRIAGVKHALDQQRELVPSEAE
jgi:hypothetical protein